MGVGPLNTVEAYDTAVDTWSTITPMPTARQGVFAGAVARAHVIGGQTGGTFFDAVESYDSMTGVWTTESPMPTPRAGAGVARTPNGKLYVCGGNNEVGFQSVVEVYDP